MEQVNSLNFRGCLTDVKITSPQEADELMYLATKFSDAPISGFHVGAVAVGVSGRLYLGANMEFSGVPLSVSLHAEQSAILNAWSHGEKAIDELFVSAAPCGHCRQFLWELPNSSELKVSFGAEQYRLSNLLPHAFDALTNNGQTLLDCPIYALEHIFPDQPKLACQAILAARESYTPYSNAPEGVAIECVDGSIFTGRTAESAAFNPTVSAVVSALNQRNFSQSRSEAITAVVHAKIPTSINGQRDLTKSLMRRISNVEVQAVAIEML